VTLRSRIPSLTPSPFVAAWRRIHALLPDASDLRAIRRQPRRDLIAGVTVAVVALPLALAFGISSGLGAEAGLVTAVVAGLLAAIFGGSNLQISGPTGAMTVVLVPIIATFGPDGVLVVGLMAGIILLVLAYGGAGRYMRYVPLPLLEGFTIGIAVIIGLQQVPAALGLAPGKEGILLGAAQAIGASVVSPHWTSILIAVAVATSMLLSARFRPGVPASLVAVGLATVIAAVASLDVPLIGAIPAGIPAPRLPSIDPHLLGALVLPAIAVAALAALESLMSASVADGMTVGERHDPDRELFGQGIANLAVPLFGGIPATAAIARTAVNVRSGARSRLAAITQSATLLLVVLLASRWVAFIPLASLAGVLIATAVQMVEVSSITALLRSTKGDGVVLLLTAAATVAFDLVTAVVLGMIVAGAIALRQVARAARLEELPLDHADHEAEERLVFDEHIVVYRLDGSLFFGAAHAFLLDLSEMTDVRVVVLRMSRVVTLDATGASVLADTIKRLEARGTTVLLSGIRREHAVVLDRLGVYDQLAHERHVFERTPEAIGHARVHAARLGHLVVA
jgi:MFS superfamily sulfate permease-like transporter